MSDITERFKVKAEDGTVYNAIVLQDRIDTSTMEGKKSFTYGLKKLQLDDGRTMNMIDNDTFEIVESGERLIRAK